MRKRNFAGQPAGGGNITILTGRELLTDVAPATPRGFSNQTLFIDNCQNCDKMNDNFMNFSISPDFAQKIESGVKAKSPAPKSGGGGFLSGIDFGDLLKTGASVYTTTQQRKTAQEQGQLALEIERQRAAQERAKQEAELAKAAAEGAKAGSVAGKIKAYTVPLLVGGVVIIGGIAAYFYFKKKKIS